MMDDMMPREIAAPDVGAFAQRVRDTRAARRMSLAEVATASGMTRSHVWQIEQGRSKNPTIRLVWGLSSAFAVSPAWLLGLQTDQSPIDDLALEVAALIERRLAVRAALGDRP